jgi:hypothetical protein
MLIIKLIVNNKIKNKVNRGPFKAPYWRIITLG